ncbi:MAG: hypothetical protein HYV32_03065 [Candidatus Kerfeldbacteria bacterium]|nr:hypothetical protein [Candidatus Kerfeldbacteria bacterium]
MKINEYINLLQSRFEDFIEVTDEHPFFLGLFNYVDFLESNPELEKILSGLVEEQKKAKEPLLAAEKIAVADLIRILNDLKKFIKKNKLDYSSVKNEFETFEGFLNGSVQGGGPSLVFKLKGRISNIIDRLYNDISNKKLISSFKKDKYSSAALPSSVDIYFEQEKLYQSLCAVNIWPDYEDINEIYWMMKDGVNQYTKLYKEAWQDGKLDFAKRCIADYIKSMCGEWENIQQGKILESPVLFNKKKIYLAVKRLHRYILTELHKEKNVGKTPTSNHLKTKITLTWITLKKNNSNIKLVVNNLYDHPLDLDTIHTNWVGYLYTICENSSIEYHKSTQDYINSAACPIFKKLKLSKIKLLTKSYNNSKLTPDVKSEIISERSYKVRLNKKKSSS